MDWDEEAEDAEIAELNVLLKMAGKSASIFRYRDGPGFVFRCFWPLSAGGGFEEDELYDDSIDSKAFEKLKIRVHRICNTQMAREFEKEHMKP